MGKTVSLVQGIEKTAHRKALIIVVLLIILLPFACLVLADAGAAKIFGEER